MPKSENGRDVLKFVLKGGAGNCVKAARYGRRGGRLSVDALKPAELDADGGQVGV